MGIAAAEMYSFARAYLPAARCKPKPFLLPGSILLPIGCGSILFFHNDSASNDNEATAPPPRHGPADGGAGSVRHEREGTTKASGATLFARAQRRQHN